MPLYKIMDPNFEILGEVTAPRLDMAVRQFRKETARIIPGIWAFPADYSVKSLLNEPPPGFVAFRDILKSDSPLDTIPCWICDKDA